MKFAYHTAQSLKDAEVVLLGVPDEKGSHALRKGTAKAPDRIRKVSRERLLYERNGKKNLVTVSSGPFKTKLYDMGNVPKRNVQKTIKKLVKEKKFCVIGGDHSITAEILSAFDTPISVIYFDAHPDLVCSSKHYYGSVVCDMLSAGKINVKKSVEVGIRDIEAEEVQNFKKFHLLAITSLEVEKKGVEAVWRKIKKHVKGEVYISIDIDVLDPAEAPGVSTPAPGGLRYEQLLFLLKKILKLKVVGFDIMEVTPKYDIQDMTSHLAAKLIAEIASQMK